MDSTLAVAVKGVSKAYGDILALDGVDLSIPKGAMVGVVGHNGAGKTTLFKILMGLVRPSRGTVGVLGKDPGGGASARERVGYLSQDFRSLPGMTAMDTVVFSLRAGGMRSGKELRDHAGDWLERLGLGDLADSRVKSLSGGERQRLGLAQALLGEPELVILDEPAASLDPGGRRDVLDLLQGHKGNRTFLISTHILGDLERIADWLVFLRQGRVVLSGPADKLNARITGNKYKVQVRGWSESMAHKLKSEPWVRSVGILGASTDGISEVEVEAWDPRVLEERLLRLLLAESGLDVVSFGKIKGDLESLYTGLMEGGQGDGIR